MVSPAPHGTLNERHLYCPTLFVDSLLNMATHQFYREYGPLQISTDTRVYVLGILLRGLGCLLPRWVLDKVSKFPASS